MESVDGGFPVKVTLHMMENQLPHFYNVIELVLAHFS